MWITWMTMMLVQKGMDTVFEILIDNDQKELDLLKKLGQGNQGTSQGLDEALAKQFWGQV